MAVFRIERTKNYTVMSNYHLRDKALSLKSKGLLSMMLSLPEDWNYTTRGLAKICKEGVVGLRDCVQRLIDLEMDAAAPEAAIQGQMAELNRLYDDFSAKYGLINDRANRLAFADDSSYYLLCALEVLDEDGKLERKADMFSKRTIKPHEAVTTVDTASEALAVSISEKACVDMAYMEQLTGKTSEELAAELQGVIFRVPGQAEPDGRPHYVTSDEYLSGNVRRKLRQAQRVAETDPSFAVNVEALTAAQPKDLDASEIEVRLGATWIDKEYIQQFMYETFDTPFYLQRSIEVHYTPFTAEWQISGKTAVGQNNVAAYSTYGTERANAYKILEDSLNLRDVRIYDTVEDADGKEFADRETSYMDVVRDSIEQRAEAALDTQRELPLYRHDAAHAREQDDLDLYRASRRANIACKEAIETAIADNYRDNRLDRDAVPQVIEQFGYTRTLYVLANTVQQKDWDGRFSSANKTWAKTVDIPPNPDGFGGERNLDFVVDSHSGLVDLFLTQARQDYLRLQPLTPEEIQAEAARLLQELRVPDTPNSPHGTHYMARVSPDFLARAGTQAHDQLMKLLPFRSLAITGLVDRPGTYVTILASEDRSKELRQRRPSVRRQLKQEPHPAEKGEKKAPARKKTEPER